MVAFKMLEELVETKEMNAKKKNTVHDVSVDEISNLHHANYEIIAKTVYFVGDDKPMFVMPRQNFSCNQQTE